MLLLTSPEYCLLFEVTSNPQFVSPLLGQAAFGKNQDVLQGLFFLAIGPEGDQAKSQILHRSTSAWSVIVISLRLLTIV